MHFSKEFGMKLAGLLLLPAGWGIVMTAVMLFSGVGLRWSFVLAGICVEAVGLALAFLGTRHPKAAAAE
jgi:sugar phosphate permease